MEGADAYDLSQATGAAAEETLRSVGDLVGGGTGRHIAATLIDGVHAAAEWLAGKFSD